MQVAARKKGGKCLSEEYQGSQKHLLWECAKGHTWKAVPNPIINTSPGVQNAVDAEKLRSKK